MEKTLLRKIHALEEKYLHPWFRKHWPGWITANAVTGFKFFLTAILIFGCFNFLMYKNWVLTIFLVVMVCDFFDGIIARAFGAVSEAGAFADPLSDKLATTPILLALAMTPFLMTTLLKTSLPAFAFTVFALWILIGLDFCLLSTEILAKILKRNGASGLRGKAKLHFMAYGIVALMIFPDGFWGPALLWCAVPLALGSLIGHLEPFIFENKVSK